MGRVNRKKKHGKKARDKANPIGGHGSAAEGSSVSQGSSSGGVLEGLGSLDTAVRESSCMAIASMFSTLEYGHGNSSNDTNWAVAKKLLDGGVVRALLHRLVDAAPSVRLNAAGALHNISGTGDPRICERMVHDDSLTPLLKLLGDSSSGGVVVEANEAAHAQAAVLKQMLLCLTNLLEASDVAVSRFTQQGGLKVLLALLGSGGGGERSRSEIFDAALAVLHLVTDSNPVLVQQLMDAPTAVDSLVTLVGAGAADTALPMLPATSRLHAAGVLTQVLGYLCEEPQSSRRGQLEILEPARFVEVIIPVLMESVEYDAEGLTRAKAELAQALPAPAPRSRPQSVNGDNSGVLEMEEDQGGQEPAPLPIPPPPTAKQKKEVDYDGMSEEASIRWQWKEAVAQPLKVAVEVLNDVSSLGVEEGSADEEEGLLEEWESDDVAGGGAGAVVAAAAAAPFTNVSSQGGTDFSSRLAAAVHAKLLSIEALPKVLSVVTKLVEVNVAEDSSLPNGISKDIAELRVTCALCAANLLQNAPLKSLGDLEQMWNTVCSLVQHACSSTVGRRASPEMVAALSSILWGLVRRDSAGGARLASKLPSGMGEQVDSSIDLIFGLCDPANVHANVETRVNAVAILSGLGSASVHNEACNRVLGSALVAALDDPCPLVQSEALNGIMDIYGGQDIEAYDRVFADGGMLQALQRVAGDFKAKVRREGAQHGQDALAHMKETALNTTRFIKYKREHK